MGVSLRLGVWTALPLGLAAAAAQGASGQMSPLPPDHTALTSPTSYLAMAAFLQALPATAGLSVAVAGESVEGRRLYAVRLRGGPAPAVRVLLYAQQHGDEVAGKEALLYLLRDLAARPRHLPRSVELWVVPTVNPDGGERGTRRNAAGADLNRDHMTLEQPETQALHRLVRQLRPHVAVDCHEYTRDTEERRARGWVGWADIAMDGLNHPLFDPGVVAAAARWVAAAEAPLARAGYRYMRYTVGGLPPEEELRHSSPDIDGALNALGMYGGLSFIIEAGVFRAADRPHADLGRRVDAYLVLLRHLLWEAGRHRQDWRIVEASRRRPLPPFLPTNVLWVNPGLQVRHFPVLASEGGHTLRIPTANWMSTVAVKSTVPTPLAYAVAAAAAPQFALLCDRHGIPYEVLAAPRRVRAEVCTLLRVEEEFDEVYSRYGGRTIVRRHPPEERELPAGALWVALVGEAALRAALVLEPAALYSLYQYPAYRALVGPDGTLPVLRVVGSGPARG